MFYLPLLYLYGRQGAKNWKAELVMKLAFDRAERPDLYEPVLAEYRETEAVPLVELADAR